MSLQFLISILEWLEAAFIKNAEAKLEAADLIEEKIQSLQLVEFDHRRDAALAQKLALKIDKLLSE